MGQAQSASDESTSTHGQPQQQHPQRGGSTTNRSGASSSSSFGAPPSLSSSNNNNDDTITSLASDHNNIMNSNNSGSNSRRMPFGRLLQPSGSASSVRSRSLPSLGQNNSSGKDDGDDDDYDYNSNDNNDEAIQFHNNDDNNNDADDPPPPPPFRPVIRPFVSRTLVPELQQQHEQQLRRRQRPPASPPPPPPPLSPGPPSLVSLDGASLNTNNNNDSHHRLRRTSSAGNSSSGATPTTPDRRRFIHRPSSPPELLQQTITTRMIGDDEHDTFDAHDDDLNNSRLSTFDSATLYRRSSTCSNDSSFSMGPEGLLAFEEPLDRPFFPVPAPRSEWMGRSIETLVLGHSAGARAPLLHWIAGDNSSEQLLTDYTNNTSSPDDCYFFFRRRSTASTFGGGRRSSTGGRRGSLSLQQNHGGTLAYLNRRGSASAGPMYRPRRNGSTSNNSGSTGNNHHNHNNANNSNIANRSNASKAAGGRTNLVWSLLAREATGRSLIQRPEPLTANLVQISGPSMFAKVDGPASGMAGEVGLLVTAIQIGDWSETQSIVSRLAPRLIGDPVAAHAAAQYRAAQAANNNNNPPPPPPPPQDPNLPPNTPQYHAGGGRLGLEREAFLSAGGVNVLLQLFTDKSIVGLQVAQSHNARDASRELVETRLGTCWNEALASLRELVFALPRRVIPILASPQHDYFLPFLFTLLSHGGCFDCAAALIEEILGVMSSQNRELGGPPVPSSTFYLGRVPDLYSLWNGLSCRQLAHFCRILALLVFEPEDRHLLESPQVLKSMGLLQLRRNRAVRAGQDSSVDMNQSILLGDPEMLTKLVQLLQILNYAPNLADSHKPQQVLTVYPFIPDTLVMVGLGELEEFSEVSRQLDLAGNGFPDERPSRRGNVANLLTELHTSLEQHSNNVNNNNNNANGNNHQLGYIIHVISAAHRAGIVVGRRRGSNSSSNPQQRHNNNNSGADRPTTVSILTLDPTTGTPIQETVNTEDGIDGATIVASVADILTDRLVLQEQQRFDSSHDGNHYASTQGLIRTAEEAANALQFNAIMLGPYQVEILFVLCTLLGGRRKLDAQDKFHELGLLPVLEDLFERLPWFVSGDEEENEDSSNTRSHNHDHDHHHHHHHHHHGDGEHDGDESGGMHGPGCECTPESALCVQYLRLVHNFCDRDCDNYDGRRSMLSNDERAYIFPPPLGHSVHTSRDSLRPGLLSKIVRAFCRESDESPYRFWLASCIESYLRGSSSREQLFTAHSGLLDHLVEDISSDRLHCAGSLQTSFDLLGEMGKGNEQVVELLVQRLDEDRFRKLMSVAAANLVDSNVFIRSLLLTLERLSSGDTMSPLFMGRQSTWQADSGDRSRSYLSHTWWDATPLSLGDEEVDQSDVQKTGETESDNARQSDWFPAYDMVNREGATSVVPQGASESVGHFGWVFSPAGDFLSEEAYMPNTLERLSWFLAANQARLLRDLLGVVDLRNINHENICCLNTAVVIAIFANRRQTLPAILSELRRMSEEEKETEMRAASFNENNDVVDRAFIQAMKHLDLDRQQEGPHFARARRASLSDNASTAGNQIGDRRDVMRNFREVLWFWLQYYTFRGRDRLSLEFSSHLRFQEWRNVVSLLAADDGSPTSLVSSPVRLPRSPYQRAARVGPESPLRGGAAENLTMRRYDNRDAQAYNEHASRAADLSNANVAKNVLSIERSVRDIDQNKRRRFLYQIPLDNPSIPIMPVELNDSIQARIPGRQKTAVIRSDIVNDKPRQVLEIWHGLELTRRIVLSEDLHGKVVSDPGGFGRPSWNSDETLLVYSAERKVPKFDSFFGDAPIGDTVKGAQYTLGYGRTESWGEKYHKISALLDLFVVDTTTGRVEQVNNTPKSQDASNSLGSFTLGQAVFSPDDKSVVYTGWDAGEGGEMPRRLGLIYCQQRPSKLYQSPILNLRERLASAEEADGERVADNNYVVLTPDARISRSPRFSPPNESGLVRLVYLSSEKAFDTHFGCLELHSFDWNEGAANLDSHKVIVSEVWDPAQSASESGTIEGLRFPGLYLLELPEECFFSADCLLLPTQWGSCQKVVTVSLLSGALRLVQVTADEISGDKFLCISPDGDAIFASSRLDMPTNVIRIAQDALSSRPENENSIFSFQAISAASYPARSHAEPSKLTCQLHSVETPPSVEGVDIPQPLQSVLLLPDPKEHPNPPLIVVPHGGPHSCSTTSFVPSYSYFCGHGGYAVLTVNYRGSTGFGQGLLQSLPTRIGELDVKDVIAATQSVIDSGKVDPDRVGICGGSHGGFLVGHCTARFPSLFKAAAMRNPVVNIPTMVTATDIPDWCYVEVLGQHDWQKYQPPSKEQLDAMFDKSPIRYFEDVVTPTLVAIGLQDLRVPPSQGLEWYHSLRSKNVPTKLLAYEGNDHAIDGVAAEADHWINIKQWFDEHLK